MRVRENLSGIISSIGKNNTNSIFSSMVGKVFGIITTFNTPTKELFEREGGFSGMGTIFYLDYEQSKNINETDLKFCKIAKPFSSNQKKYPLIGELVLLFDLPSPVSQLSNNSIQKYYLNTISVWNNPQHNSPSDIPLGKTFVETNDITNLLTFEGDIIYQGRKNNGFRLGSTVKKFSNENEWSSVGNDGDPITILVNGYRVSNNINIPHVEEINKELSSIYMTSTQLIPLLPDRNDSLNQLTKPIKPNKYFNKSQLILNSDRIVLNSKKDEVMIFAKSNIELNTNNIINLNAGERTHLNSPFNFIGIASDGTLPTEPLLLGNQTVNLLTELMLVLGELGSELSSVITPPAGSPLIEVNIAGNKLTNSIDNMMGKLEKIISQQNYTS